MRAVSVWLGPGATLDAPAFGTGTGLVFAAPALTLVGHGVAATWSASEAAGRLAALACEDRVGRAGSGPVAHGALPFEPGSPGRVVLPALGFGRGPDGRVWATAILGDGEPEPTVQALATRLDQLNGTGGAAGPGRAGRPEVTAITARPDPEGYRAMVAAAVERIGTGALGKVVLSRAVDLALDRPIDPVAVLRRIRSQEPSCTAFSHAVPDGRFLGASPELLVSRRGREVRCHPLAGTVAQGGGTEADKAAATALLASAKDGSEHDFVVAELVRRLAGFCHPVTYSPTPTLVALRSVAHLGTDIVGTLQRPVGVLELLAALHPTPAVGGTPTARALELITALEPGPRGQWAGPVGWVDARGDGDWMIGIRSVTLSGDGRTAWLRAGAGIVAGSDPASELAETTVKLTPMIEALVAGSSGLLG